MLAAFFRTLMSWRRSALAIVVVGLTFRILLIPSVLPWLGTPTNHFERNEPSHIAAHLLRGDGFASPYTDAPLPTAQQPPLYPLFIAVIFKVFGVFSSASLYVILLANCLAGALTALLIYRAGRKYFSPNVGTLSAWMWAVFAPIAVTDLTLSNYAFASLSVVLWINFVPDLAQRIRNWVFLGFTVGLMLLLNPALLLLVPASALWFKKKQAVIVLATVLLAISPWYLRNYRVMGHFYPALRDNLGMELYLGNHPGMSGTCDYWTGESPYGSQLPKVGEARFFAIREKEAVAYIKSAPMDFISRSLRRLAAFWLSPWPLAYAFLLLLAIWGLKFAPTSFGVFTGTLFIFYPLVYYATQAAWPSAYRHPIEPLMLLMAAQPVCRFGRRLRTLRSQAASE
jgi:Dolichyl-phosphate-mannose-protein mannosyltransferase